MELHTTRPRRAARPAGRLGPLFFEMGRLLKQNLASDGCSLLHLETMRFIAERGAPSMGELAEYLRASKPTVSALAESLHDDGLVERRSDPRDRRKTLLRLSQAGEATLRRAGQRRERAVERLFAPLPGRDRESLARMLAFIINRQS